MLARFPFALPPSMGREQAIERAALLESYLRAGGVDVEVRVAADYRELKQELISGALKAAWGPPFICARVETYGGRGLVRGIRNGGSSYRAALVARTDRQLALGKSTGLRLAWVDPDSVSGCLLPRAVLRERGSLGFQFIAEERYLGSYRAALEQVLAGKADAAGVWAPLEPPAGPLPALVELVGARAAELSVLGFSSACPNDGVVLSPFAPRGVAQALEHAFLNMAATAVGREILGTVFGAQRFELAPAGSYRALNQLVFGSAA